MIEIIMSAVGCALAAVFSVVIYILLVAKILPQLCVRLATPQKRLGDRGIRKYSFPEGRGIVYEPDIKIRKFVKQYVLVSHNGDKYIKCMVNPKVRFIKYDVIVYGPDDKLIDVISVSEAILDDGYTKAIPLPTETSYVNVVLRTADGMYKNSRHAVGYSGRSLLVFAILVMAATVVESYIVRFMVSGAITAFLENSSVAINNFTFFMLSLVVGIACAAFAVLSYYLRMVWVINNERR